MNPGVDAPWMQQPDRLGDRTPGIGREDGRPARYPIARRHDQAAGLPVPGQMGEFQTADKAKKTDEAMKLFKDAWEKSVKEKNADGKQYLELIKDGKLPGKND